VANINVKKALERIRREINQVGKHIQFHSGVDKRDANLVDDAATDIAVTAAQIAEIARQAAGQRETGLVKRTRKTLGFTYP